MEIAIEAISRWLDDHFNTTFYARTETRYYTAEFSDLIWVDDLISITSIKTDSGGDGTYEITFTTADYWLEPRNAQLQTEKRPYRQIRINPNGTNNFPTNRYGVEIVGSWGYSAVAPKTIKQAALLMAHRIYKRKDAIFGIAGTSALGTMIVQAKIQQDSDLVLLLDGIDIRGW